MFKHWQPFLFGLFAGLLSSGVILLVSRAPSGVPVQLEPPPTIAPTATPVPVRVHVAGAVNAPGIYALPHGAIVSDALAAAGGVSPSADLDALNLAQLLADGVQVYVAERAPEEADGASAGVRSSGVTAGSAGGEASAPIDINTASAGDLEALPGIGPSLAGRIVEYREANGPFQAVDDLQNVRGIGDATLEDIRDLVTVGP